VPNPFDRETEIRFRILEGGPAQLSVYALDGRLVRRLLDRPMSPGEYVERLDAADLAPGVYHLKLETAGTSEARKLVRGR
jgi:hypothetical protein